MFGRSANLRLMGFSDNLIKPEDFKKYQSLRVYVFHTSYNLKTSYNEEPRPEYAPKKKSVNKPRAASPPTVATIQRGTLPILLILIVVIKK